MNETTFKIRGMCCAEEVSLLRREITPLLERDERLSFDLLNETMSIDAFLSEQRIETVVGCVRKTGMDAFPADASVESGLPERDSSESERTVWWNNRALLAAMSLLATLTGWTISTYAVGGFRQVSFFFYAIAILSGFRYVLPRAWHSFRRMRPDIHLLMVIAVVGGIFIHEWLEACIIAGLFAVSLLLESWSIGRARNAVSRLIRQGPSIARRLNGAGQEELVDPAELAIGDMVLVKPGESIPVDGRIAHGTGFIQEANVTGESLPVTRSFADKVYSGTLSLDGTLQIVAVRRSTDSTYAKIVRLVNEAAARRSVAERWVERFALYYTPAIVLTALVVGTLPFWNSDLLWSEWIYRGLVVLVIGCPCALVISTPVSIVSGLATAARHGLLIRGGEILEVPSRLKMIALDKTGTLTLGRPEVTTILPFDDFTTDEILSIAGAIESNSRHPLAQAIVDYARENGQDLERAELPVTSEGEGIRGLVGGSQYFVGSMRYIRRIRNEIEVNASDDIQIEPEINEIPEAVNARCRSLEEEGHSVVLVADEKRVIGLIALADGMREESVEAVREIHDLGLRVAMLTGDNHGSAQRIANAAGIDRVYAELLPDQKLERIEELVEEHEWVAMVGDGVNDAPALARASLGIAMAESGTDVAIETADIALMSDDLRRIPWVIRHSRNVMTVIRQNVAFALATKLAFFLATLFGFATLWGAIVADIGATLLVTFNALRLLKSPDLQDVRRNGP